MSAGVSTFPLRFRQPHIRELVRVVAEREGISQNELLEQAAEHEVVARGALLAEELLASATRLGTMSAAAYQSLVESSLEEFARGESLPDPLRSRLITRHPDTDGGFGAVAAFGRAKPGVMAGPGWSDDQPGDQARIAANCGRLLVEIRAAAQARQTPTEDETKRWHTAIYEGCAVPAAVYVGNFRGDPHYRDLLDREVGVGPTLADGYPERMGVWAADVAVEVGVFFDRLQHAFAALDHHLALGARPNTVDLLHEAVALTAVVHGEWIRIHPFVNGNSSTARLLAACVSLRYGLPVYVALKPRPADVAYARAAKASMGRPPDFAGDHKESIAVFAHLLTLAVLPP